MTKTPDKFNGTPVKPSRLTKRDHVSQVKDPRGQVRKKTLLAALLMFIPFCLCIYFIFSSSSEAIEPGGDGINTSIPDGKIQQIEASKQKAVERVVSEEVAQQKMQPLDQFRESDEQERVLQLSTRLPTAAVDHPQSAHREMARQIESFYREPMVDPQTEALQREIEALRKELADQKAAKTKPAADPMALVEQQYALATKYFKTPEPQPVSVKATDKITVTKIRRRSDNVVSTLAQVPEDSALLTQLARPRNDGFHTPVGGKEALGSNAIRACIAQDQTLSGNARLKLRLLEPLWAGELLIPENTLLYGEAQVDRQRLTVAVSSIEYEGNIIEVNLTAHDMDGQPGLHIPASAERTALKEGAANIGAGLGTSVSFARSAGQQVAMDLVRGAMSGGSQYIASKMREVKVSVKAGYNILLVSKE